MKIDQWKQKVKEKVIEKERHEWIATGMMYQRVKETKSLEVSIKTGWGWWQVARWYYMYVYSSASSLCLYT